MLNKDEERNIKLVNEYLEQIKDICLNTEEKYPEEKYYEFCDFCHQELNRTRMPYWDMTSDLFDKILSIQNIINTILSKAFVKQITLEQKLKYKTRKRKKELTLKEKSRKEGIKQGRLETLKKFEQENWKLGNKKYHEGYTEGYDEARKNSKMTDKEILNKAKLIELNQKLGLKKRSDKKNGEM